MTAAGTRVVELAGGVGGARLARGLQLRVGSDLTVIVNTGDDLERHGLLVCPDHDTVLYTLAGIEGPFGWGIDGDTSAVMTQLAIYGEETWFGLGDRDLAGHIVRSARIRAGATLTEANLGLQRSLGIPARILPMADEAVRTEVRTPAGWLEFQEYFVHRHQEPEVLEVRFQGIERARSTEPVGASLAAAEVIVIAPSNPIVSVGPILAVPGLRGRSRPPGGRHAGRRHLRDHRRARPEGTGRPDARLARPRVERPGRGPAVCRAGQRDRHRPDRCRPACPIEALGLPTLVTDTVMVDDASRARVADEVLAFARSLAAAG